MSPQTWSGLRSSREPRAGAGPGGGRGRAQDPTGCVWRIKLRASQYIGRSLSATNAGMLTAALFPASQAPGGGAMGARACCEARQTRVPILPSYLAFLSGCRTKGTVCVTPALGRPAPSSLSPPPPPVSGPPVPPRASPSACPSRSNSKPPPRPSG